MVSFLPLLRITRKAFPGAHKNKRMINGKDFHRSTMPHDIITALRRFNFTVETDYTFCRRPAPNFIVI